MKAVKIFGWFTLAVFSLIAILVSITGITILLLPKVSELDGCFTTSMYSVYLCSTGTHYAKFNEISPYVAEAIVASEDTAFFSHNGFDWYEMEQSFKQNLSEKHIHRGGSTITQQLAKNLWLSKEKSYFRKIKEAYLTYQLEKQFEKKFLLEKYLNVVEFGPNLFGVKDAAEFYFHKSPSQLHLLEAAYLAFLLPNPEVYSKNFKNGKLTPFATKIISIILNRLATFKKISPDEYQFAKNNLSTFPWTQLSVADFKNAHGIAGAPIEFNENAQDLDQFYSGETQEAPATSAPKVAPTKPAQAAGGDDSTPVPDEDLPEAPENPPDQP